MTAAQRHRIRRAVDARARLLLADQSTSECGLCGKPLTQDKWSGQRRFCSDAHRKEAHWRFGTYPQRAAA